jgi:hypothetical protein
MVHVEKLVDDVTKYKGKLSIWTNEEGDTFLMWEYDTPLERPGSSYMKKISAMTKKVGKVENQAEFHLDLITFMTDVIEEAGK